MKKTLCILVCLLMCISLVVPAFADTFVPSISYKDHPDADDFEMCDSNGNQIAPVEGKTLVITSVQDAQKGTDTGISDENREELVDVYQQLENGTMKLPYEGNAEGMVIRDLFDVSIYGNDAQQEELKKDGVCMKLTLDLGIARGVTPVVMVYADGKWTPAESVVNNGNGTVTVVLEDLGIIAVSVKSGEDKPVDLMPPKTGDEVGRQMALWVSVMGASFATLVVLLISRDKKRR